MKKPILLVLEEGACPFMSGPDYACCYSNLGLFR
jgi:hypothetical protein